MANFAHDRASPGSNWGVADAPPAPQLDSQQLSVQGTSGSGGPSRNIRPSSDSRPKPYSSRPPQKQKQGNQDRNKFLDVSSPLVPRSLPEWMRASRDIGQSFDQNSRSNPKVNRGYALPDPGFIATMTNSAISSPMFEPLSPTSWRDLLGIDSFGNKPDSFVSQRRNDVQTKLMDCMKAGKLEGTIDLSKMGTATVLWRDQPLPNPLPENASLAFGAGITTRATLETETKFCRRIDILFVEEDLTIVTEDKTISLCNIIEGTFGFTFPRRNHKVNFKELETEHKEMIMAFSEYCRNELPEAVFKETPFTKTIPRLHFFYVGWNAAKKWGVYSIFALWEEAELQGNGYATEIQAGTVKDNRFKCRYVGEDSAGPRGMIVVLLVIVVAGLCVLSRESRQRFPSRYILEPTGKLPK
ncbi:hypothetical protein BDZ89DRAFT_1139238 [Hymenopellis radicata]|nr:hypothetical protein BDZ89DRAFT_1139238 [Hymenopellis radicata]